MADKLFAKHILRKLFLEDWGLKLLALAITVALWLGVTGLSTNSRRSIVVPLNTIVSNDAIITNSLRQEVEIVLGGDKRRLDQLNRSDISASLDLTAVVPGEWVIQLSPDTVSINNLPQGINLDEIRPTNMLVKLDAVLEKDVVVRPLTVGAIPPGFEVYSSSVMPPRIRMRGPASVMKLLEYVQTDEIDLSGRREGFTTRQIAVNSPDPKAVVLNTVVDVFFLIGERRIERSFSIAMSDESGKTASFTLFGPRTILQGTKADDIKIEMFVDGDGEMRPRVVLPADLEGVTEIRGMKLR